jgi:hypothetical protein
MRKNIDLLSYKYPVVDENMLAFSTLKTDEFLLSEANLRGYCHLNSNEGGLELFDQIFYLGGRIIYKENISDEKLEPIARYLVALMRSWEPKHEHKRAVAGMLMDEICDIKQSLIESKKKSNE